MTKQYQLPREFAEKWVAELRSGKYQQITGCFTKGVNCFCALGLGYVVKGAVPIKNYYNSHWSLEGVAFADNEVFLLFDDITAMNDEGVKFPEIADWIESNVEFV